MTPTTISEYLTTSSSSPPSQKDISDAVLYTVVGYLSVLAVVGSATCPCWRWSCYLSVLAVVGSAGNAFVLYVFSKKDQLTSTITLFVIALATADFITCLDVSDGTFNVLQLQESTSHLDQSDFPYLQSSNDTDHNNFITCLVVIPFTVYMEIVDFHVLSDVCCKIYQFFITSNIPFSAFVMVAIAVDRYMCICQPFTRLLTLHRAKVLIGLLAAVAASLGACVAMFFGVYVRSEDVAGNATELDWANATLTPLDNYYVTTHAVVDADSDDGLINTGKCAANDLILSHEFQWYYQKLFAFMYPACLLVVVVLYALIYHSVVRRRYKRQQEKNKTFAMVRLAQKKADRQRQIETSSRAIDDGSLTVQGPTSLTTDVNGCASSLLVGLSHVSRILVR